MLNFRLFSHLGWWRVLLESGVSGSCFMCRDTFLLTKHLKLSKACPLDKGMFLYDCVSLKNHQECELGDMDSLVY